MATVKSSKLTLNYRGATLRFGIHQPTGQYRKKYKGRTLYLGSDPNEVLSQWIEKTDLVEDELNGTVEVQADNLKLSDLCNLFLDVKKSKLENGELAPATYQNYFLYSKKLLKFFGRSKPINELKPRDFARLRADFSKPKDQRVKGKKTKKPRKEVLSLNGLKTKIRHVKVIFNFAVDEGYLASVPWTKATFSPPVQKAITKQAIKKPPKQATREEIKAVLGIADDTYSAVILLALNSGSANEDCAMLKWSDISKDGWVETPSNKTSKPRRFKLWPETIEALSKITKRYDDGLVFHGRQGGTLCRKTKTNPISKKFTELAIAANVRRENLTFYSLRHTFQNVADESRDFPAVQYIMGHSGSTMSDNYRGKPSDDRLEAVGEFVRQWFFGNE